MAHLAGKKVTTTEKSVLEQLIWSAKLQRWNAFRCLPPAALPEREREKQQAPCKCAQIACKRLAAAARLEPPSLFPSWRYDGGRAPNRPFLPTLTDKKRVGRTDRGEYRRENREKGRDQENYFAQTWSIVKSQLRCLQDRGLGRCRPLRRQNVIRPPLSAWEEPSHK